MVPYLYRSEHLPSGIAPQVKAPSDSPAAQQSYLQASIVDKGTPKSDLKYSQIDAIVGSLFSVMIAAFIVIACAATLFVHGHHEIRDAADAAQSLRPLSGEYAYLLFANGLLNASLFAASILPLSTAYTACEALGFESGLNKRFREAPVFYWLYTALIIIGGDHLDSTRSASEAGGALTSVERSPTAICARVHAASGEQARTDGSSHQLSPFTMWWLGV